MSVLYIIRTNERKVEAAGRCTLHSQALVARTILRLDQSKMRSCPLWKECASTDADSVDSCLVLRTRKRARQPAAAFQHRTILRLHRIKTTFSSSFEHVQLRLRPPWSRADLSRRERRPRLPAAFQHRVRDRRVHAYQDTEPDERSVPLPPILQRQRASYQISSTVTGPSHLNSHPP